MPEIEYGRTTRSGESTDDMVAREVDAMRFQRSERPGPSRPLIARIGRVQSICRHGTMEQSMAKEDRKGKKKATREDMDRIEEEDRREREEEYQRYLRFCEQEIARDPLPREVRQIADCEEEYRRRDLESRVDRLERLLESSNTRNQQLEEELNKVRGTKRPSSRTEEEKDSHKRQKTPQPDLRSRLSESRTPRGPRKDENDPAPGYLSDDALNRLVESTKKDPITKPSSKKITESSRRMITLIPCWVGGASVYMPTLSQDSRVHGTEIPETPSVQEWISELTAGMGLRPIHPDERPPPAIRSPRYSDSDDDYNEEEEEPKYLRIHRNNPIPEHAPQYKKDERTRWLAAEKKKHDQSVRDKAITHYHQVLAAWEKQPGKIPTWLEMVEVNGREERDNAFWGMYGPGFLYLEWQNVILVNNEAVDAA